MAYIVERLSNKKIKTGSGDKGVQAFIDKRIIQMQKIDKVCCSSLGRNFSDGLITCSIATKFVIG